MNVLIKEISSSVEYNFENFDNRLACNALPCDNSENKSETVLNNKKLAYNIDEPNIDAKIISLTNPNPFFIMLEQNIYIKSKTDFEEKMLLIDIYYYPFTPIWIYLNPLLLIKSDLN